MAVKKISPWGVFLFAFALALPLVYLSDIPQRDVLGRYAPMAEALIAGNWVEAFHPRIPLLFPCLGAAISAVVGCDAFMAVKLAATLCFALTVFPLWKIFRLVFNEQTALTGTILLAICPYWLRLASSGMRESAKLLFFTWTVYGLLLVFRYRRSLKGYWIAGAGCGLMVLIRDDSLLIGGVIGLALVVLELISTKRFPWRSILAGVVGLLFLLPAVVVNYQFTGYPCVSFRFVTITSRLVSPDMFGHFGGKLPRLTPGASAIPEGNLLVPPDTVAVEAAPATTAPAPENQIRGNEFFRFQPVTWECFVDFLDSMLKGSYFFFAIPALLMIALRLRYKSWTRLESILFWCWLGHGLLIVLQILIFDRYLYVSRRYLLPAAPLAFGWTALLLQQGYAYASKRYCAAKVRKTAWILGGIVFCLLYLDAFHPQLKMRFHRKHAGEREALLVLSKTIRADYHGPTHQTDPVYRSDSYATFRRPLVVSETLPELGFMAGGEGCAITPDEALRAGLQADYMVAFFRGGEAPREYPGYTMTMVERESLGVYGLYTRKEKVK